MTRSTRQSFAWTDVVMVLATLILAIVAVRWADREYLALEEPSMINPTGSVARPNWVWSLYDPYERFRHDYFWLNIVATLGIAALIARDRQTWTRRGLSRPGTVMVAVTLLTGGVTTLHSFFPARLGLVRDNKLSYGLLYLLEHRVPGAILGAWVVLWLGRKRRQSPGWRDRLGRLVGSLWMANIALLITYSLLFG